MKLIPLLTFESSWITDEQFANEPVLEFYCPLWYFSEGLWEIADGESKRIILNGTERIITGYVIDPLDNSVNVTFKRA